MCLPHLLTLVTAGAPGEIQHGKHQLPHRSPNEHNFVRRPFGDPFVADSVSNRTGALSKRWRGAPVQVFWVAPAFYGG